MPGAKGMMLAVLLTLMAGKLHDGTPGRDGTYQQEVDGDGEEEEMEVEETGNGEGADGGMSTRAKAARGNRRGMEREDVRGRRDASARQNSNADRERKWRGGGHLEQFETKTAKSFRKKDMPRLMTEKSGQPPSKRVIDSWLTNAKLVMASEDLDWIVNLTHAMRKSTDTDEYYIKHPTGRKLLLEEEAFDTSDKGEVLKIMQHLVAHKAPAREHAMLRKGDKYTEDLAMQDFKR